MTEMVRLPILKNDQTPTQKYLEIDVDVLLNLVGPLHPSKVRIVTPDIYVGSIRDCAHDGCRGEIMWTGQYWWHTEGYHNHNGIPKENR
jgi:hypothetical protein